MTEQTPESEALASIKEVTDQTDPAYFDGAVDETCDDPCDPELHQWHDDEGYDIRPTIWQLYHQIDERGDYAGVRLKLQLYTPVLWVDTVFGEIGATSSEGETYTRRMRWGMAEKVTSSYKDFYEGSK